MNLIKEPAIRGGDDKRTGLKTEDINFFEDPGWQESKNLEELHKEAVIM